MRYTLIVKMDGRVITQRQYRTLLAAQADAFSWSVGDFEVEIRKN